MHTMNDYLATIKEETYRFRLQEIFQWIKINFPTLDFKIGWNQPMYTEHETFIIGFSVAKQHIAISPEAKGIEMFLKEIEEAGYTHGSNIFRIKWNEEVNYTLLKNIIIYNLEDKANCSSFWRP